MSKMQLHLLENTIHIYIDSTFKTAPTNYYQLTNILVKIGNNNSVIPICNIIITHKSYYSYMHIFNEIKFMLYLKKINIDWKEKVFITDFEKGLAKAISEQFPNSKYYGCKFPIRVSKWITLVLQEIIPLNFEKMLRQYLKIY